MMRHTILWAAVLGLSLGVFSARSRGDASGTSDPNAAGRGTDERAGMTADSNHPSKSEKAGQEEKKSNALIAWWKLDEAEGKAASDASGNDRTGTLTGNPQWQPAGGKVGGALLFDGDGDSVEIGSESAFDATSAMTVAAWIKVGAFDKRWQALVTKGDTAWRLQRTAEAATLSLHCTGIQSARGEWPLGIEGRRRVDDGAWHHVVGVYDGATIFLYIDGVLDSFSEASGSIQANDFPVCIGGNSEQSGRDWNGLIDEVCIFACAIDANEVRALQAGKAPTAIQGTAVVARPAVAEPKSEPPSAVPAGAGQPIEGNWRATSSQMGQSFPMKIWREPDGTLGASVTTDDPDQGPVRMRLDKVTYENGILRFAATSGEGAFEGTMKEDGSAVEGQWRQGGQAMALVLTRVQAAPSAAPSPRASAAARTSKVQNRSGLVAWWKLDDNTSDSLGACPGTARGNPTYTAGKSGRAISFDGDDCVDCGKPDALDFGAGNWAVSAWIRTTQSGTESPNKGTVFAAGADEVHGIRYTLAVNEMQSGCITLTTDDDLYKVQATGRTVVNDGAWHHVVGTRDGRTLRVYVDGALDGTSDLPPGHDLSGASSQNAWIGAITDNRDGSLYKYFVGEIDEVCVFAGSLGDHHVKALCSGTDPMTVAQEAAGAALVQTSAEPLPGRMGGVGFALTTLVLVLVLVGIIAGIVLFLIKSNGR